MDSGISYLIILILIIFLILIGWWLCRPTIKEAVPADKKYFLTAGAIFKNEGHILKEWLDHHRKEGFEHIYLVNDNSTDNYLEILQPYLDEDYVTLINLPDNLDGFSKQGYAMKKILYPIAKKEANWFIANDLDEFITTRDNRSVSFNLKKYFNDAKVIRLDNIIFGSNDLIDIPKSVKAYNRRANLNNFHRFRTDVKTICRPEFIDDINIHRPSSYYYPAIGSNPLFPTKINATETDLDNYKIVMYHYKSQALNFWQNIKMSRGDADSSHQRLLNHFKEINDYANEVVDDSFSNKQYDRDRIDIVISRYNESLDWLKELNYIFRKRSVNYNIHLHIYNCGGPIENIPKIDHLTIHLHQIENRGMGLYKFLTHIINNYHNLAHMTMLLPGSALQPNKREWTLKLLNGDWEARTIYTNTINAPDLYNFTLENYTNQGCRNKIDKKIKLKPAPIQPFGRWFEKTFNKPFPKGWVKTNFADIIGFSKEAILTNKIEIYQTLAEQLDDVHTEVAHYLERSWYYFVQ